MTWLTIEQAVDHYEGIFTERLLRRLVFERRVAFSHAGRKVIFDSRDLDTYLESGRVTPAEHLANVIGLPYGRSTRGGATGPRTSRARRRGS